MLPFAENDIVDGDTIYLAIHGMYRDRIPALLAAVPPSIRYLQRYRLLVMSFGEHLEQIRLFDQLSDCIDFPVPAWSGGGHLDPVVGLVMTDHASFRGRKQPTLFLFSDGNLVTHWNLGILSQTIRAIWLHEPSDEPTLTPFGVRFAVNLQEQEQQDQPGRDGEQPN